MRLPVIASATVAATLVLAGCQVAGLPPVGDPTTTGSIEVPWQLTPASTASEAQGETTAAVLDRQFGLVRGTPTALRYLHTAMTPFPGIHRAVEPCREAVLAQTASKGAYEVQAAAAGPDRRGRDGTSTSRVFFRIFYRTGPFAVAEIRQAALECTVDRSGRLVGAGMATQPADTVQVPPT